MGTWWLPRRGGAKPFPPPEVIPLTSLEGIETTPSFSPDGTQVAFAWTPAGEVRSDIYVKTVRSGRLEHLTAGPASNDHPTWSPDGLWIAFRRAAGSQQAIYLVSPLDGRERKLLELNRDYSPKGEPRRLTRQRGFIRGVAWAPDGQSVVYSLSSDARADAYLWRTRAFGGGKPERLDLVGRRATWPAVSRRGNRLVFRRGGLDYDIWRFEVGESGKASLFSERWDLNPQFSPAGERIAFSSRRGDGRSAIWVSSADGSDPLPLTTSSELTKGYPAWSPDGRWIAYDEIGETGTQDVHVVEATGGQPRQLTHHPSEDSLPSWSRDGEWIYFHSTRSGRGVMRIPAAGGDAVPVTKHGGYKPLVSHDGKTLYYVRPPATTASVPLFAMPAGGGPERPVLDSTRAQGFWVVEEGLYDFAPAAGEGAVPLRFHDFATGESRLVTTVEGRFARDLAVSPDGKTVLFCMMSSPRMDLMLVENFR